MQVLDIKLQVSLLRQGKPIINGWKIYVATVYKSICFHFRSLLENTGCLYTSEVGVYCIIIQVPGIK